MKRLALLAAAVAAMSLAACETPGAARPEPEPRIVTVEVPVPVPVKCTPDVGPDPVYPDTDEAIAAAPNLFERVKLVVAGRLMRIARERELSAALRECRG
jgi:hypothetical protein